MLDVAIPQTSSKLQEELKKKSTSDQKITKRKDIFVETPSTATWGEESSTVNPKLILPGAHIQKSNNYLAITLNSLKDKQDSNLAKNSYRAA